MYLVLDKRFKLCYTKYINLVKGIIMDKKIKKTKDTYEYLIRLDIKYEDKLHNLSKIHGKSISNIIRPSIIKRINQLEKEIKIGVNDV